MRKNCSNRGKGFKIGTNEAHNERSKLGLRIFENSLLLFVCQYDYLRQRHSNEEENSWKNFYLTSRIKHYQWKELTKLIQTDPGIISIGWIIAEIFDLENRPKLMNKHTLKFFWWNSKCHNSARISPIHLIHGQFWISFESSFLMWDLYCE